MGLVYPAVDVQTGEKVALKIATDGPGVPAERFLREAGLLAEIAHPAIVRYLAHGTTPQGEHYLAMEWLEGETLEERLVRQPPTVLEALRLAQRVLEALEVAHRHGVVHRDIKPANLFLPGREMGKVKLLDFGIARRIFDSRQSLTSAGSALGTPLYMAPEQARGSNEVDGRADFFSLGCVLYECFTGAPPFAGGNAVTVLAKASLGQGIDLGHRRPDLNRRLVGLVERMLARDPVQRPADASELIQSLARITAEITNPDAQAAPSDSDDAHPVLVSTGERRLVSAVLVERPTACGASRARDASVSVADLAGVMAVALAEAAPGEDGFAQLEKAISRLGARAESLEQGRLLAALLDNSQNTPTDQAVQAARCALKLKALLPDARVAIGTGRVMSTPDASADNVIESAAGALAQAHPGNIVVDEASARLLEARFELVPELDGAMRLLFEKGLRDAPRTLLGREVPCVGRDREINSLVSLYKECVAEGAARVMLITAAAGGGKSRVQYEFCERLQSQAENFELLIARGDPVRASAPLGLLGMAVRASAGIAGGEPDPVQRKRLGARVARHIRGEDASRITLFLGELANIPFEDHESPALRAARQDPRLMADQMLAAWVDWLEAECRHRPVVLLMEDLHWGDVPSVQFVDAALRTLREQPLMVLAAARPDVDQRFPKLWVDRNLQHISLAPLGHRACRKLIANALGELAPEMVERIIARADGNPFYLEEILRAVAKGGRVEDLPETVAGMVQARLDALGSDAKLILRAGSIFGRSFRAAGIKAMVREDLRDDVDRWLQIITQKEILSSRPAANTREFTFRHDLLRETAYEMLAPKDRVLGHRLAAEWLESVAEREAIVIADHFEKGQVPARAVHWLRQAAQQALDSDDLGAAIERVERAVELGAKGEELCALRVVESHARFWRGEYEEAEQAARQALSSADAALKLRATSALFEGLGPQAKYDEIAERLRDLSETPVDRALVNPWVECMANAAAYLGAGGNNEMRRRTLDLFGKFEGQLDPILIGRAETTRAHLARVDGRPTVTIAGFRAAAEYYGTAGHKRAACEALGNLASSLTEVGLLEEAEVSIRRVLETAERMNLNYIVGGALLILGLVLAHRGCLDEARATCERALALSGAQNDPICQGYAEAYLSIVEYLAGNFSGAEERARQALAAFEDVHALRPFAQALRARALLKLGPGSEARDLAQEAYERLVRVGEVDDGEMTIRLAFAESLLATADRVRAGAVLGEASEKLARLAGAIDDESIRQSFLTRTPDHRRILELSFELGHPSRTLK